MTTTPSPPGSPSATARTLELLKSRAYVALLVVGAIIGVPVAAIAYFFLKLVSEAQTWFFTTAPKQLGFKAAPMWWPLPLLAVGGLLVGLSIRYLPGTSGHKPAEGLKSGGPVPTIELPGIVLASLATLCLGAVLGPEAPLILIGNGIAILLLHLLKKDAPQQAALVIGAAGSFAAIATLLGSPIVGAFLLMEMAGVAGAELDLVLVPGLLAAGIGALVFVGLDSLTGFGTFALAVPNIPHFGTPTIAEFGWALVIGVAAAILGTAIRRLALALQPIVERHMVLLTPVLGLAVAGLAIAFAEATNKSNSEVLFSGQSALPALIQQAATWTAGALVLLVVFKGLAYGLSMAGFRGGPVFPSLFIGAAGGMALSHLAGLPMIAGTAMGIGAMSAVMLGLPLTAVLLASLILEADAVVLMPLVIVAVVVAYVVTARLTPAPPADSAPAPPSTSQAPAPVASTNPG